MSLKGSKDKEEKAVLDDVIVIDLSPIRKKAFRIDGDNSRVIHLNTSDLNITVRLEEVYPKFLQLANKASAELENVDKEERNSELIGILKNIDKEMRELLDYVFDSDVAEKTADGGSMYDPFNGKFRFEHIIEVLAGLYDTNFQQEAILM